MIIAKFPGIDSFNKKCTAEARKQGELETNENIRLMKCLNLISHFAHVQTSVDYVEIDVRRLFSLDRFQPDDIPTSATVYTHQRRKLSSPVPRGETGC